MAVWMYAYGKNGMMADKKNKAEDYLEILNSIPLQETKILDSMAESKNTEFSIRKHYAEHRAQIESGFKAMTDDDYRTYLDSIKRPFIAIDKIVDQFIVDGERRVQEQQSHFDFAYKQFENGIARSTWELCENGSFINRLCYFSGYDALRLNFQNDLVWITGPFAVFSKYFTFLQQISAESREYYHCYFKNILKALRSDFILYAHEWSGLDNEDNEAFDLAELKASSNWEITSSDSLHTMDKYYYEPITEKRS